MEKLIQILEVLADKYQFTDEEVAEINDALYGDENGIEYGDEYAAEEDFNEYDEEEDE